MADEKITNDIQQALEKQVADMRAELKRLSKSLASHSGELRERAEDAMDDASGRFRHAAQAVRERGQVVAETVRENPGTATTLLELPESSAFSSALPSAVPFLIDADSNTHSSVHAALDARALFVLFTKSCGLLAAWHWQFATGRSLPGQNKDKRNNALQDCDVA